MPIGAERLYWAKDALAAKDLEAAHYREEVANVIESSLERLLNELGEADQTP